MMVVVDGLQADNRSGTGAYATALARWLPEAAPDARFVFLWPEHTAPPEGSRAEFAPSRAASPLGRLLAVQAGLPGLARLRGADLLHYPANFGNWFHRGDAVVTIHDVSFLVHPEWFRPGRAAYYRLAVSRAVRTARRLITDSNATAGDLMERLGVASDRIDVVPLGVDPAFGAVAPETRAAARARYGLPERFFLYVGTHEPRKNLGRLVEAFERIADSCPHDLILAGRSGWKNGPLRRKIEASRWRDRIRMPGFIRREDLPAVMAAAQAFVWPSLYEGFGLPPLEAMACGVPVLTSCVSSLPETVGDAALTVDPRDTEAIAAGMARLAEDDALRAGLARKGRERAEGFAWRRTAELTVAAYRRAIGER